MVAWCGVRKRGWTAAKKRQADQPVARHGQQDAGLAEQHHEQHAGDPSDGTEAMMNTATGRPSSPKAWAIGASMSMCAVRHHPGQHGRHEHVEDGAEPERDDDADRDIALRVARFLGVVETESKPM